MKRTLRWLTALTAATSLLALGACGRDGGGDAGTNPTAGNTIAEGKATGSLTVWAMGAKGEKLPELLKGFKEQNPDVNVQVTAIPWDSAHNKFTTAIASGQTPDLAMVGTTWMGEFVGMNALDATPPSFDKGAFFEGAYKTTEVNGTSYGVPWYVETRVLYYRTDLAEKAGMTTPPKDWQGLKDMAKAMQAKGGAKWGISLQPGQTGSWQTLMPFAWSNGATLTDESGKKFTFDTPEMTEALAYYQSFFTDGIANKAPAEGSTEADFTNGSVPMFISGPWMMSAVEKAGGSGFADKYNVAVIPTAKSSASFVGGSNLAVFKNTKNRDAAWKLVQYLTDPKVQVEWHKISTDLPSVQSAWEDQALSGDEKMAVFGEQLKTAVAPPAITTWEQVAAKLDAQVEQVCKSGLDPAAALKTVQQEATSIGTGNS